jgi:hypothetical protein
MKKHHLGPQNGPRSLGTEKLLKIVSCQKIVLSQLEKVVINTYETQFQFVILLSSEILREKPTLPSNTISPKYEDNLVLQSHQN